MTARLPALDGLRAVAALLVVATHAAYLTGFTVNGGLLGRLAGRGDFGVAIFFALSGFLLHHGLVSDARNGDTDLRAYAVRRVARVLPAYWVTLAVVVLASQPGHRTALAQAFAVQTYLSDSDIPSFSQSWSIPTELSFYIVLPLVVWLLGRVRRRHPDLPVQLLVASAVAATVALALMPVGTIGEDVLIERWLPARWPNFAVGMVLAELVLNPGSRAARVTRRVARDSVGCLLVAGAALLLATTPIAGPLTLGLVSGTQLSVRLALSTVVAGLPARTPRCSAATTPTARHWVSRPARSVGAVSYGLFLWHLPVFSAIYALTGATVFTGRRPAPARRRAADQPVPRLAEPRRRRTAGHALGGTSGAAPASTPAAMTLSDARLDPGRASGGPGRSGPPARRPRSPARRRRRQRGRRSRCGAGGARRAPGRRRARPTARPRPTRSRGPRGDDQRVRPGVGARRCRHDHAAPVGHERGDRQEQHQQQTQPQGPPVRRVRCEHHLERPRRRPREGRSPDGNRRPPPG